MGRHRNRDGLLTATRAEAAPPHKEVALPPHSQGPAWTVEASYSHSTKEGNCKARSAWPCKLSRNLCTR